MLKKIKFLAIVPSTRNNTTVFNAYFFCKNTRQMFSIKVSEEIVDFAIKKEKHQRDRYVNQKFTENLRALNITEIIVKKRGFGEYNTVIRIGQRFISKKITTSFYSGFIMSRLLNITMKIENKILREDGIYITKKLLEDSLAQV